MLSYGQPNQILSLQLAYNNTVRMEEKEDNDLIMPLTYKNRFAKLIFTNKTIDKLAYKPTILCLAVGFLVFFGISVYMFAAMGSVKVVNVEYFSPGGNACLPGTTCKIPFNITETMQPPIYVMYQLQNFYQNERLFIQSKSNRQLAGVTIGQQQAKICTPYITNSQMNVTLSWAGVPLNPDAIASPCGMFPRAFFNDSYSITKNGQTIPIDQTGISWPGDQGGKYKRAVDSNSTQWIDPENEHFIVWMRAAGIPNFKKIWGKINQPLLPGQYELHISNNYNLPNWQDNKYVVLTTMSPVGGQNYLLPVQMFIVSLLSLGGAIYLSWRARVFRKLQ